MTFMAFLSAVLALLLAPGPTNTLIGLAGARAGASGVLRLLPAELLGYLTTILAFAYLGAEVLGRWPQTAGVLKLAAALWVMFLAIHVWRQRNDAGADSEVTVPKVYLTTLLNPKALIVGLVLLPPLEDPGFSAKLGLFCVAVVGVALLWGTAGALIRNRGSDDRRLDMLQRIASVWLAVVSLTLITSVIRA